MATTPAQILQAERLKYPGMLPREIIIMRNWLKLHEAEYDRFAFNIRIGAGHDPGPVHEDNIRQMAIQNTQKRIDAVAYSGTGVTLIEVKDRAGFSAVGQLVGYDALWRQDHPTDPEPKLLLVCNRFVQDILPLLTRQHIELAVVEADFGELRRS
jgi:hypothetical protein